MIWTPCCLFFGGSSVGHLHPDVEICLFMVHTFGMDSELLLEKCCCRTNRNKLGMKLRCLDRDFGPAACEQLCPPRSASFHCTGDSNFMAIASPLFLGRKCTSVPLDNPGLLVSLSPVTKPTEQLFIPGLDLECPFDTLLDNNYCQKLLKEEVWWAWAQPCCPSQLPKLQRMSILNPSKDVFPLGAVKDP